MIEHKEVTETVLKPYAIICDICGKQYSYQHDMTEVQEFVHINFMGGYESVFGDSTKIECDICQHCFMKKLGQYCRTTVKE